MSWGQIALNQEELQDGTAGSQLVAVMICIRNLLC